jgi:hypothetical protein
MKRTAPFPGKLPRFNHYVPRFILDNFASKGQLSTFDKHTLGRFKLPPYRAMGAEGFNNVLVGDNVLLFELVGRISQIVGRISEA